MVLLQESQLVVVYALYALYTLSQQDTRSNIRAVLTYGILYFKKKKIYHSLSLSPCQCHYATQIVYRLSPSRGKRNISIGHNTIVLY